MGDIPKDTIPSQCTVLIVGGGPAGSYAASALAREGVDVVLLEASPFPRYHIGESMLPAMRFMLKYIGADEKFVKHGFTKKNGAAFKLAKNKKEGYTDFLDVGGPENYTWNVVRSEADELLFRHAQESGAKAFDGVKVDSITFKDGKPTDGKISRPVSATYTVKSGNVSGEIKFDYLIDASGRTGLISTRYMKSRIHNQSLNNNAIWAYWKGTGKYMPGSKRENSPFFEALHDETGWAWFIPLHIGTSVGIVMDKNIMAEKKRSQPGLSSQDFYLQQLELAPALREIIGDGELITPLDESSSVKSGADTSYSAPTYAGDRWRICGDAGCFIDPFFSTGVHLAALGGLSAAMTICASIRGDCPEEDAGKFHSDRVASSYTWFLMVVLGAYKQMRAQSEPVLSDVNKDDFDRAFAEIRPVIQGALDVQGSFTQAELIKTLDLCTKVLAISQPDDRQAVLDKLQGPPDATVVKGEAAEVNTEKDKDAFDYVRSRKLLKATDTMSNINSFSTTAINGWLPRLEVGKLGLVRA